MVFMSENKVSSRSESSTFAVALPAAANPKWKNQSENDFERG